MCILKLLNILFILSLNSFSYNNLSFDIMQIRKESRHFTMSLFFFERVFDDMTA